MRAHLLAAAVLVALAPMPVVQAAPQRQVCNIVPDPPGDGRPAVIGIQNVQSLDIVTVDFATGPTRITAIMKLASLEPNIMTTNGVRYSVLFWIGDANYGFHLRRGFNQTDNFSLEPNGKQYPLTTSIDPAKATITWSVDRKAIPGVRPGVTKYTKLAGTTMGMGFSADSTIGSYEYVDRTPSCLRPR